jgi:uncharacterized protein (DUF736 family)
LIEQEIDMLIGNFTYDAGEDTYSGDITTLSMQRSGVQLRPNKKTGDWDPDYRMIAEMDGGTVEFGAAWKRKSEKGRPFLSVALDDPALSSPVNAALFLDEDGEAAALVWNRPKRKSKAAE